MTSPAERLKEARIAAGFLSALAAATAMGIAPATYVQHENGNRGFRADSAERYARFFKTTPEWLLYGRGEEPRSAFPLRAKGIERWIPVLGVVQAGAWSEVADEPWEPEIIPISLEGFEGAQLFALRVQGPSMDKFYPDGSLVVVCPAAEAGVREGDHVVVRRMRGPLAETTIKEVVQEKSGVALWPRSSDRRFQEPIRLETVRDADNGPEIIGVVVAGYVIRPIQRRPLIQL
jgi:SOS-response transcriptional repressor LexA